MKTSLGPKLGKRGAAVRPSFLPLHSAHRRIQQNVRVSALLNKITTKNTKDSVEEAIVIPLNYAQLLNLRGRDFYLDPQITSAHDDLTAFDLDASYSSVARLGKEKMLFAAREGLRTAKGRVSLIHPDIAVEPVLLPGAMALLEQAGQYELVIQLSQQAKSVTSRDIRPNNRTTMRDYERDVALASALAHCGLAKKDLEAQRPAMGCARLEEALYMLRECSASTGSTPFAQDLQSNIMNALSDLKADAIYDYLTQPLDLAEVALRTQALAGLRSLLMIQADSTTEKLVSPEYVSRGFATLTSEEICGVVEWPKIIATPKMYAWWQPELLPKVGLAHIVAGFSTRKPELICTARMVLESARNTTMPVDVAIHLAVCEVLLGAPYSALDLLKEDERYGGSVNSTRTSITNRARSNYSAAAAAASLAFPERDGVMTFIRAASPEGEADLLPGLCLFVEQWLQRLAFPLMRDSQERPPLASLAAYFDDPRTEQFLESRENTSFFSILSNAATVTPVMLSKATQIVGTAAGTVTALPARFLKFLLRQKHIAYGVGAIAAVAAIAVGVRMKGGAGASQQTSRSLSGQAPGGTAAAAAARRTSFKNPFSSRKQTTLPTDATATTQTQTTTTLTKDAAQRLVKQWLDIKAEAMGPRHTTTRLSTVLAEPMLKAVTTEAREAASSGWFWNIRPLRARIVSIDGSALTAEGDGYAVVVASVDESADLWATNGKKGDSYQSEYKVEYTMVRGGGGQGGWKIASALVIGK
ncbi:putative Protein ACCUMULATION AND REPLICATION OF CHLOROPLASTS 6, chloroplastic [Nannochloris sp. 'desiccata']|nr:hypothetical protein KSW81_000421 [Chlorella desiccata (nom. nud.)]KAH7620945.1 putative Protein ACCUMULATION AND REPLICATION OF CHLOROPLASTS 6, chloroplastic [Chlorella desiccata (nom. nud.)]